MVASPPQPETHDGPNRVLLSTTATVLLAIVLGLCGGYLDLVIMLVMKYWWNDRNYFWSASDFPWSVPFAHAFLLGIAGAVVALFNRVVPRWPVTPGAAAWLFAMVAIWSAFLRAPLYGIATLALAGGLARPASAAVIALCRHPRQGRCAVGAILGLLVVLAASSSGLRAVREYRAIVPQPAPVRGARNVVLIVWDTVRAPSMSLYGYDRDNTPNLRRWARKGARYTRAIAPATWTYPSHSSFFTGKWPYQLNTQWNYRLDTASPTLAEFLTSRGYQTAGFAANTQCCSYETGLDRGFTHYEDYPLTPESLLGRTEPGQWVLANLVSPGDFYEARWIKCQSRDARATTDAFLDWLNGRKTDHPFFAFLNFYDAHGPYVPPPKYSGRFGIEPKYPNDYFLLFDFRMAADDPNWDRNIDMARGCYDDCIASLDDQFGRLMSELLRKRLLDNTVVIVTGDHGESFGDHYLFNHATGLYIDQIAVPLLILSPDTPANLSVDTPVSLRDLPATVVDLLGLSPGSPFPGYSLASFWTSAPGQAPPKTTPALSEIVGGPPTFRYRDDPTGRAFQMSLMTLRWHYFRDYLGREQLYDMGRDMGEQTNLVGSAEGEKELTNLRRILLETLTSERGSIEVENAYLKTYRQQLESLVQASRPPVEPTTVVTGTP